MSSFVSPVDELAIFWERRFTVVQARPRGKSENGVYDPKSLLSWEFWPNFLRLGDQVYYLAKVYYLWVYYLGGSTVLAISRSRLCQCCAFRVSTLIAAIKYNKIVTLFRSFGGFIAKIVTFRKLIGVHKTNCVHIKTQLFTRMITHLQNVDISLWTDRSQH